MKNLQNKYSMGYINNVVNRDNSKNNLFMDGQKECANHAQSVIAELIIKGFMLTEVLEKALNTDLTDSGKTFALCSEIKAALTVSQFK